MSHSKMEKKHKVKRKPITDKLNFHTYRININIQEYNMLSAFKTNRSKNRKTKKKQKRNKRNSHGTNC